MLSVFGPSVMYALYLYIALHDIVVAMLWGAMIWVATRLVVDGCALHRVLLLLRRLNLNKASQCTCTVIHSSGRDLCSNYLG